MNVKLFISTFFLIFLAELGDKTQLTAMAKGASGDKWMVFFMASAALICSTLIAVLFGSALTRVIPERYIGLAAGGLFIVFGIMTVGDVFWGEPASAETETAAASTFFMIFLAELGDKTQLTAMARGASGERWTVFFSSSAALTCSTFIAVLFGSTLTRIVPEMYITLAAGGLFIILGLLLIYNICKPKEKAAPEGESAVPLPKGLLASVAFEMAAEFEEAAVEDYELLARSCKDPELKDLLNSIAEDEREHLRKVRKGEVDHKDSDVAKAVAETDDLPTLPSMETLTHDVAHHDKPIIEHAIEHERATAGFYEALATAAAIPSLKEVFSALAAEEYEHARRLEDYQETTRDA